MLRVLVNNAALLHSLADKARVSPVLAGQALVDGAQLTVRLPQGDVSVQAPRALLKLVFKWCDGQRTWAEILPRLPAALRETFDAFLAFLFESRAVVDANLLTVTAAGWGQQTSAIGVAAPDALTLQIAQRFTSPLLCRHPRVGGDPQQHHDRMDPRLREDDG